MRKTNDGRGRMRRRSSVAIGAGLTLVLAVAAAAQGSPQRQPARDVHGTQSFWANAPRPPALEGVRVGVHAKKFRTLTLDTAPLRAVLAGAPRERTDAAVESPLVISLPAPDGSFQRFALQESAIMAPGLARLHPDI